MNDYQTLIEAANILREVATRATRGPWEANCYDSGHSEFEFSCSVVENKYGDRVVGFDYLGNRKYNEKYAKDDGYNDAHYIALMDPIIGKQIALWLEDAAKWVDSGVANHDGRALVIAELIIEKMG